MTVPEEVRAKAHSQELLEMCRLHFNEPMILHLEVVRCIGYAETGVDCYILTMAAGGKVTWATCVGGYVFLSTLRGEETAGPWDEFLRLDNSLTCSGCPPAAEMRIEFRHDYMER